MTADEAHKLVLSCGVELPVPLQENTPLSSDDSEPATIASATEEDGGTWGEGVVLQAAVATDADFEYTQKFADTTAANARILAILNGVDAIFTRDLDITLQITFQHAWITEGRPLYFVTPWHTPTTVPSALGDKL